MSTIIFVEINMLHKDTWMFTFTFSTQYSFVSLKKRSHVGCYWPFCVTLLQVTNAFYLWIIDKHEVTFIVHRCITLYHNVQRTKGSLPSLKQQWLVLLTSELNFSISSYPSSIFHFEGLTIAGKGGFINTSSHNDLLHFWHFDPEAIVAKENFTTAKHWAILSCVWVTCA